jgi:hypothetical protein
MLQVYYSRLLQSFGLFVPKKFDVWYFGGLDFSKYSVKIGGRWEVT